METVTRPGRLGMRLFVPLLMAAFWLGLATSPVQGQQGERRGWLGVQVELAATDAGRGLPIRSVLPGGPGARAHLLPGDVILEIGGLRATRATLEAALAEIRPGDELDLLVARGGVERRVAVLAAPRPRVPAGAQSQERMRWGERPPTMVGMRAVAGAEFRGLDPALARYFGVERGILVLAVAEGTPAQASGLEPGDVVKSVDGEPVRTVGELRRLLIQGRVTGRSPDSSFQLQIVRDGDDLTLELAMTRVPPR